MRCKACDIAIPNAPYDKETDTFEDLCGTCLTIARDALTALLNKTNEVPLDYSPFYEDTKPADVLGGRPYRALGDWNFVIVRKSSE